MSSFIFSLNATMPIFLLMVVGYFLRRIGILDRNFALKANTLVFRICLPCMLFHDLADTHILKNFNFHYVGFCFFSTLISILTIWFLAKHLLRDHASVGSFVQCSYRSSAAILGIAFISNIYGNAGMAPLMIIGAVPLYNIFAVIILTLESPHAETINHHVQIKKAFINILKNPIILGIFLGLAASCIDLKLPHILDKTIENLGIMTSPLALIAIGVTFEGKKAIAKIKPTLVASFIKLIGLAAVFIPLAIHFGFHDQELIAILIMLASPCTPTSYIMAQAMDGDDVLAASVVVSTTFFSSVTLTLWIFLLRACALIH